MPKSGQARVLTKEQKEHLFEVIQQHRHPEKNTAIMQISFKLGLRAQEIALLQIKEITNIIHEQNKSVKIAGHVNPSTTLIYEEPPEESIKEALKILE
ncbi:hypothetical protein [Aliikangiella sp. IMCC44632]